MKFTRDDRTSTASPPWVYAMAGALLLGLASLSIVGGTSLAGGGTEIQTGDDDDSGADSTVSGFGRFQPDEEAVGTLPTRDDDGEDEDDLLGPAALPSFFIEGPRSEVMASFVSMSGDGEIEVDPVENDGNGGGGSASGADEVRVTFSGHVRLTFDAATLSSQALMIGLSTHEEVGSTVATAMSSNHLLLMEEVPQSSGLEVPLGSFARLGLLDQGVYMITSNRIRGRDHFGITSYGGLIEIEQGLLSN